MSEYVVGDSSRRASSMVNFLSFYCNRLCFALHGLASELDGALGFLERYLVLGLESFPDISTMKTNTVNTRSMIAMYI